jgi:ABC-type multidrug transport system ATPase subunit
VQHSVAYLPQNPAAFVDLTVFERIYYTGQLRGLTPTESRKQTVELIDTFKLTDCGNRVFSYLSGGQMRLVNLCAALIGSREILVLDEPTDPHTYAGQGSHIQTRYEQDRVDAGPSNRLWEAHRL